MGPLAVVALEPGLGEIAHLGDRFKGIRIEDFGAVTPIEAFDVGVLIRLARLNGRLGSLRQSGSPRGEHDVSLHSILTEFAGDREPQCVSCGVLKRRVVRQCDCAKQAPGGLKDVVCSWLTPHASRSLVPRFTYFAWT